MTTPSLPELRQVVLLTSDLEGTLSTLRAAFGVPQGFRDVEGMAAIGFKHSVVGFDRTYVEVCEPSDPESPLGQKTKAKGDSGFMVVVQVKDSAAMVARAAGLGIEPIFVKDHHGSPISQWRPRDFGTLAEFDQINPEEGWHFAPAVYDARSTSVVDDIVALDISVEDPAAMARRWATVLGASVDEDGTSVDAGGRTIRFNTRPGVRGLHTVECRAGDRARAGERNRISGVDFVLV